MPAGASSLLMSACPADPMAEGKGGPLSPLTENRQRLSEPEKGQACKPVLLAKTNCLDFEAAAGRSGWDAELAMSRELSKPCLGKPVALKAHSQQRLSTLTKQPCLQERLEDIGAQKRELKGSSSQLGPRHLMSIVSREPADGIVCLWPGPTRGEQRSAFSKPAKRPAEKPGCCPVLTTGGSSESPRELSASLTTVDIPCWAQLSTVKLIGDFWNLHMLSQNILPCNAFQGAPVQWLEHTQAQVPTPSVPSAMACRALLPPTLSSLGLSTQNWCAKCSLAFRLTTDLVFHMRSHHKKEHMGPDPHSKKRRGAALICPVCHEYFRERHHLSRHMTSHS